MFVERIKTSTMDREFYILSTITIFFDELNLETIGKTSELKLKYPSTDYWFSPASFKNCLIIYIKHVDEKFEDIEIKMKQIENLNFTFLLMLFDFKPYYSFLCDLFTRTLEIK